MKTFFIFLIFSMFFSGCADKNAFARFHMSKEQELGADSILNSKIKAGEEVAGIVSAIYLNQVFPEIYKDGEYFYVFIYLKNEKASSHFLLNDLKAESVQKLQTSNKFTYLTSVETKWNKYYLVKFPLQANILKFIFESDQSSSDPLVFEKDE